MQRRDFLLGMAAFMAGCGGGDGGDGGDGNTGNSGSGGSGSGSGSQPPNVLFLSIDDLNDWVGYLGGHPQVKTPNMDRLVARAVSFQHAYCNAPLCGPSRASALTGMYPYVTKVFDHSNPDLPADLPDLLKYFASQGYATRAMGKVYHHFVSFPHALPTDSPASNLQCSGAPSMPPQGRFDWAPLDVADAETEDGRLAAAGIDFMRQQPTTVPFFLGLGYIRTHVPWYVPKKYFDLYPLDQIQIPEVPDDDWADLPDTAISIARLQNQHACILRQNLWASAVQGYLASISYVDQQIGHVLDYLDSSPHAANTLVMLWSDNGFHLGEKFHWHKQSLWERSARVPLIIRAPGVNPAMVQQDVSLIDMFPTLLELCGLPAIGSLQGRSLVPLLQDASLPWAYPVLTTYLKNHHAIRLGQWCYIRYENGEEELYDRVADREQLTNLASLPQMAAIKAQLGQLMPALVS